MSDPHQDLNQYSQAEILRLLQELEEEEEMFQYGGEREVALVIDRRREKQKFIDAMSEISLPFYARFVLHIWVAKHHEEWSEVIVQNILLADQTDRVRSAMCLLAPRDHGKSAWFAYALPIWLGHKIYPGQYGAIVGEGDIAWDHLKHIKRGTPNGDLPGILGTPELKHLKRQGQTGWTKEWIQLSNGTEIFAKGAKSGWRGKHPRWLVVDDFLSQECIHSPTERKRSLDNLVGVMLPMVRGPVFIDGCVRPDAWVVTRDMGLQRIGDLCPGAMTEQSLYNLNMKVDGRNGFASTKEYWVNGYAKTKSIRTSVGVELEATLRHPVLRMNMQGTPEWCRMDTLEEGDYIAIKRPSPAWQSPTDIRGFKRVIEEKPKARNRLSLPDTMTPDLAYLIGLWTAEGSFESGGRVTISATEHEIRDWLFSAPFGMKFKENPETPHNLRCSAKTFLELMQHLGGHLGLAPSKKIPTALMSGDEHSARAFLQGLFDGDGNAYCKGSTQQVRLVTTSRSLAHDTQTLLLSFGVLSSVKNQGMPKPTTRAPHPNHEQWVVCMCAGDAWSYMSRIGFRLTRKMSVRKDMRNVEPYRLIPHQGPLIREMLREKPRRPRGGERRPQPGNWSAMASHRSLEYRSLLRCYNWAISWGAAGPATEQISQNLAEGFWWVTVDDIHDSECMTVDFVIPEGHSFTANGIVSHNTPMHSDDIYGHCKREKGFVYRSFPAIREDPETGKESSLWPHRFSIQQLEHIRDHEVGPLVFSREYMCRPVSSLSSLFPEELFQPPILDDSFKLRPSREWVSRTCTAAFIAADIGISANIGADFTVLWVIGLDDKGNRYVLDMLRKRGLGFRGIIREFIRMGSRYGVDAGIIESNQAQAFIADEAVIQSPFPIETHQTGPERHMLDRGIPMLRLVFENGKYRLPQGDDVSIQAMKIFMRELQAFTIDDGKVISTARHDDTVMAAWLMELLLRKMTFGGAWFDQEEGDDEGYADQWDATPEEDDEAIARLPGLYEADMSDAFGTTYRGPMSPPDPNSPEDYEKAIHDSFWAFKTGVLN